MCATSLLDAGFVLFDDDASKTNSYMYNVLRKNEPNKFSFAKI